jgi:peptide/nickel transport system substrate-binding protein
MSSSNAVPSRYGYDHVAGVESPNPYTVFVRLKQPFSPIIPDFFGGDSNYTILPAHLLARYASLDHAPYNAAPIGSGPYRVTSWRRSDRIELEANPRYYSGKPAIARIVLRTVPDPTTILNQLSTGEVSADFMASGTYLPSYERLANNRVVLRAGPYFTTFTFNVTDPLLKDVALRKAMAMAVDRRTIVRKVFHGADDPETGMRGLFNWAYDPSAGKLAYDPQAAQSLLQHDGWTVTTDGVRAKNGQRLQVQIIYAGTTKVEPPSVVLLAQQERNVGIEVSVKSYPNQEMMALDGPLNRGRYQVALIGVQSQIDPDASWLIACAERAPNGFNWARYCSPTVESALRRGYSVYDRAARRRAYSFVQRQLLNDMPYAFLWQRSEVDIIPKQLKGFTQSGYMYLSAYASAAHWRW